MELEAVEQSQAVFMSEALGCPWVTPCKRIGHPTERDPLELRSTRAGFGCVLDCVIERESSGTWVRYWPSKHWGSCQDYL